jgi:glycosyltransferase involved in cell wall biosynthesis
MGHELLPTASPAVSVIIPARDAAPTLDRTLRAMRAQRVGAPFEVIVVDDGSLDDTRAIAHAHAPFVSVIPTDIGRGPGAARNRGVAAARASILAFTDADCFPDSEWLARGLAAIIDADLVQGRVEPDPAVKRTPFDRTLQIEGDGGFYQTANLFLRREFFDSVGGFRDWALERPGRRRWSADRRRNRATFTPIGEDTLLAWSARRHGARSAFVSEAVVYHAVVPGRLRDEMADRWHWGRDMQGLVQLVPELRGTVFYRRLFLSRWTAQFDLAVAGLLCAALTQRRACLLATIPYGRRLSWEARRYNRRRVIGYALGTPVAEATTLMAFLFGGVAWRQVVL